MHIKLYEETDENDKKQKSERKKKQKIMYNSVGLGVLVSIAWSY